MIAKTILDNVVVLLTDAGGVVWPQSELLAWLNEGLAVMVKKRPDLFGKQAEHTCAAGAEQAAVFPRCVAVQEVVRVVGGRAVLLADKSALDAFNPSWMTAKAAAATNWMPHDESPKKFWLSPPAATTQKVVVRYVESPAPLTGPNDAVPLSDDWQAALTDYVGFRAFEKQVEIAGSAEAAAGFLAGFISNFPAPSTT